MVSIRSRLKTSILLVAAILLAGALAFFAYKPDRVITVNAEFAFDITDKELLVGSAGHVVIAKVLEKVKETTDGIGPVTIYTVKIEDELKGSLETDTISVAQRIGYDNLKKGVVKFEDDDYLTEGNSYILTLSYDIVFEKYRIVAPKYGNVLVKDKGNKAYDAELVAEFKDAVQNQRAYDE